MRFAMDLFRLTMCKWRGAIGIIALILGNLVTSMMIFVFFASTMHNINVYLESNFFSNELTREIVVMSNDFDAGISLDADVLNDSRVETAIFMYKTGIAVLFSERNEVEVGDGWYLSIVEWSNDVTNRLGFTDMFCSNEQPPNGILLSEQAVGYVDGLALIGEKIEFVFEEIIKSFPIIGIIPAEMDFFSGRDAGHYMYINSQLFTDSLDYIYTARLILYEVGEVAKFVEQYQSDEYILIFDEESVRHVIRVRTAIRSILMISSVVFLLLSVICIINSLRYLHYFNYQKNNLLRILGFSKRELLAINVIEGLILGFLGAMGGLVVSFFLKFLLVQTTFVIENDISVLFSINVGIVMLSVLVSNFVILIAKTIVSIESGKSNHIQMTECKYF